LISIYDEFEFLDIPFAPGRNPFFPDDRLRAELDRIQSNVFYGGRDLQNALSELAGVLRKPDSNYARELSNSLDDIFQKALASRRLLEFLIQLGTLLQFTSQFLYRVAEQYEFEPTSTRMSLISDTLRQLELRLKR